MPECSRGLGRAKPVGLGNAGLGLVGRQEGGSQGWGRVWDVQRDGNRMLEWLTGARWQGKVR